MSNSFKMKVFLVLGYDVQFIRPIGKELWICFVVFLIFKF